MKDSQDSPDQDIGDLWRRGRLWEIFRLSSGDFTTLELAKQYSALRKAYRDNREIRGIVDEAFAILNAPLTRQFYAGCRIVMQRIQNELGRTVFRHAERRIWLDLWAWVSERWQEPTEELIGTIEKKYRRHRLPDGTDAIQLPQISPDESSKPADLDSMMAAEAFAKETTCQSCGRFDHTLRVVTFPYVISIVIASFRRAGGGGVFCHRCRCAKSSKWALLSLFFGWWGIWGFFWNIGALVDNYRGGKILPELNEPLVVRLAWAHMVLGKIAEAKAALTELLTHSSNKEALQLKRELDARYPEVSPAKTAKFRLGYLTLTFAILGVYTIAGFALFGGSPPPQTYALTTSISPFGAGWVSPSGGEYESGEQVTLTASPASGYTFDQWTGAASGTSPTTIVTMYSNRSIIAHFKAIPVVGEILFSDDFSDEADGWDTYTAEYGSVFYESGWLHLTNNNPAEFVTGTWAGEYFTDFVLEIETKLVAGTESNWHIVECRYVDNRHCYRFGISADGYYFIGKFVDGNWIGLEAATYSSYIHQGFGAVNLLHIECIGSNLGLSVNGHLLDRLTDTSFSGGDVVLGASALSGTFTEVAFDNIVVTEP